MRRARLQTAAPGWSSAGSATFSARTHPQATRRGRPCPARMTTTRAKVSATKRMSCEIAMTVLPASAERRDDGLDRPHSARILARRRLVEHYDRRLHRQHRCDRQQLAPRVAEVVRIGLAISRSGRPTRAPSPPPTRALRRSGRRCARRTRPLIRPSPRRSGGQDPGRPDRRAWPAERSGWCAVSSSPTVTRPSVGRNRPLKWRTNVDLPEPFWPTMATRSPARDVQVDAVQRADAARVDVANPFAADVRHQALAALASGGNSASTPAAASSRCSRTCPGGSTPSSGKTLDPQGPTAVSPSSADPASIQCEQRGCIAPRAGPCRAPRSAGPCRLEAERPAARRRPAVCPPGRAGRSARRAPGGAGASPVGRRRPRAASGRPTDAAGRAAARWSMPSASRRGSRAPGDLQVDRGRGSGRRTRLPRRPCRPPARAG